MRTLAFAGLLAAVTATGAPVAAQPIETRPPDNVVVVDEMTSEIITVTGHELNRRPYSLSEVVSVRDLDLARPNDQAVMRMRIAVAARDVCDKLNEQRPSAANLGRSCETVAIRNAMPQVRVAMAAAGAARPPYAGAYSESASAIAPDTSSTPRTYTTTPDSVSTVITAPSPDAPPPPE
jgi:UrcA family protein